jgi:cell division protease FtsH
MNSQLARFAADHQELVASAAAAAGLIDPVAFDPDEFEDAMLEASVRGPVLPVGGVLLRDWDRDWPKLSAGVNHGCRAFRLDGIWFVRVHAHAALDRPYCGYHFYLVSKSDYRRLYRAAVRLKRKRLPPVEPVLAAEHRRVLWQNAVGFLEPENLSRIRGFGGRTKRGLLFTGPPGNGKTSACRWIQAEAERRGWSTKTVSPDDYQAARKACNPADAVKELFQPGGQGVVFFDDLDIALRDRTTVKETDDQAVFLSALDGIEVTDGVVYVFTTNCPVELIDPAFRRPGRIDLTLHFPKPDHALRTQLVNRWHADIRTAIGADRIAEDTAGLSFAEIEELKNLLVLRFIDASEWNWDWAREQFHANRDGLADRKAGRTFGFTTTANGKH